MLPKPNEVRAVAPFLITQVDPFATMKLWEVFANAPIADKSASYACTSLPMATPNAVRAALAEVELVPPLAIEIGVVMVTVGFAMEFIRVGVNSTPVATVSPSVTVAVIVPITRRPSVIDIDWFLRPIRAEKRVAQQ
jgi:hypothetical protein